MIKCRRERQRANNRERVKGQATDRNGGGGLVTRIRCQSTNVNYHPFIGQQQELDKQTFMSQPLTFLANTAKIRCLWLTTVWEMRKHSGDERNERRSNNRV